MKNWTIMTYLAGDNNLSDDMVTALKGMQAVGGNDDVSVVAFYDSGHPFTESAYYAFTQETRDEPLSHCEVAIKSNRLDQVEPDNDKAIIDFVKWCKKNHQAKNYVLILSGHGDGFLGKVLLRDENPAGFVTLRQLRKLLDKVNDILDDKLDILGFDSCVMNMLEVSYELRGAAKFLIASEGLLPNSGWGYDKILQLLVNTNGRLKARDYAEDFVSKFIEFHSEYEIGGRSVDLSACDLTKIEAVVEKTGDLAELLQAEFEPLPKDYRRIFGDDASKAKYDNRNVRVLVREQLKKAVLAAHWDSQTYLFEQAVDVGDFCANLLAGCHHLREELAVFNDKTLDAYQPKSKNGQTLFDKLEKIEDACSEVLDALDKFIIKSSFTGSEYQFSRGVSFFFPWTLRGLMMVIERYKDLDFNRKTRRKWQSFLSRYLYETMREPRNSSIYVPVVTSNGHNLSELTLIGAGKFNPDANKFNPDANKFNPDANKLNIPLNKFNPDANKFNPDANKFNPDANKFNPDANKFNPDANKFNPDANKFNPIDSNRFNPDANKFNPDANKFNPFGTQSDINAFISVFSRMKNMPFLWANPRRRTK